MKMYITVEPWYNEVLGITKFLNPEIVKYMDKNLVITTNFASPLAVSYIDVPLHLN